MRAALARSLLVVAAVFLAAALAVPAAADPGKGKGKGKGQGRVVAALDVPPGHLPPPGSCRIWTPGLPPGQQKAPGPCRRLERQLGPGDWLLYRPRRGEREVVYVDVPDPERPGTLLEVRRFAIVGGHFVGVEAGTRRAWRRR